MLQLMLILVDALLFLVFGNLANHYTDMQNFLLKRHV